MGKTHWNTIVDSNYLSGEEIYGTKPIFTIRDFKKEEVTGDEGRKKNCGILYWQENVKPMIVNLTNVKRITKLFGSPYKEDWQGKQIQLTTEKTKAFGKLWDAIRVCAELPKDATPPPLVMPPSVPHCNDCNGKIKDFDKFTASQIAGNTIKRYGVPLCADCSNKRKMQAEKSAESEENINEPNA